jgi:hypothetical protein
LHRSQEYQDCDAERTHKEDNGDERVIWGLPNLLHGHLLKKEMTGAGGLSQKVSRFSDAATFSSMMRLLGLQSGEFRRDDPAAFGGKSWANQYGEEVGGLLP